IVNTISRHYPSSHLLTPNVPGSRTGGRPLVHSGTLHTRASLAHGRLPTPPVWLVLTIVGLVALGLRLAFLFRAPVFIIGDSENYFWPGYQLAREIGFALGLLPGRGL